MKTLKIIIILFSIFFSADSISAPDIKSPAAYLENFAAGEKIFWFGEVVDITVHKNKNEVVIEWLCKYLELAEPIDIDLYVKQENFNKKRAPIKVRKTKEQFFVTVLHSPDMPVKVAKEAAESVMKSKHFAIREAETDFIGQFKGKPVVFVGGGRGTVANNIEIIYAN